MAPGRARARVSYAPPAVEEERPSILDADVAGCLENIKDQFRQLDKDDNGFINASVFIDVLAKLGIPESTTHSVVARCCPELSGIVRYNDILESIFVEESTPSSALVAKPVSSMKVVSRLRPRLVDEDRRRTLHLGFGSGCNGIRSLLRALQTLRLGRLCNADDPVKALAVFCSETSVSNDTHARMRETFVEVLQSEANDPKAALVEEPDADEAVIWEKFARWCAEQMMLEVFEVSNRSCSGELSMEELMVLLMIIAVQRDEGDGITPQDAQQVIQEFDITGSGKLSVEEFLNMVHELEREADVWSDKAHQNCPRQLSSGVGEPPHLVLNFDVNNTVLIKDSVSGADAYILIATTLAGTCWGIKHRNQTGSPWILVDHQPRAHPPWEGLTSYAQHVEEAFPYPNDGTLEEIKAVKKQQRMALRTFCDPGQPGECMRPHLTRVLEVLKKSTTQLLPSFYFLLHTLKRAGRKFSIVFRTFGVDVNSSFEQDFNDFCEGKCPYFEAGGLKLDGSDGGPDHRMDLSDPASIGTFHRSLDNDISLVWGTLQQPPENAAGEALGLDFYKDYVDIIKHVGVEAASDSLRERVCSSTRTVVLRDHYPGWAKQNFNSTGGKPIFVNIEDDEVYQLIFDDHAQPESPSIVDVIDVREYPKRVPMAQVYDIHMVKAIPLRSIVEVSYFWDELRRCEAAKRKQLMRRKKVAKMLHDVEALSSCIRILGGGCESDGLDGLAMTKHNSIDVVHEELHELATAVHYTAWHNNDIVRHAAPLPPDATESPEARKSLFVPYVEPPEETEG